MLIGQDHVELPNERKITTLFNSAGDPGAAPINLDGLIRVIAQVLVEEKLKEIGETHGKRCIHSQ